MIYLTLGLSSVFPRVSIADTAVLSGAQSIVDRFISPSNCSAVPFEKTIVEGNYYHGIYFYFLDEGPVIIGTPYTINKGLIYTPIDSTTYIDSGRTLERYLLNILSQSKVIDSILFQPLTYYVPESLFVTTGAVTGPPAEYHTTYGSLEKGNYFLFDLRGRVVPVKETRAAYRPNVPGIIISRRLSQRRIPFVLQSNK